MFNKKGENMTLKNDYEIGVSPDFGIALLRVIAGTEDADAVSMIIPAYDLQDAISRYKWEFYKEFDYPIHDCEISGRKV